MRPVHWVDVFSTGPLTGNQLAVVRDADGMSDGEMGSLAAEFGISETTFVQKAQGHGDHRVRIFTPTQELPMAGHPVVGTAWVLHNSGLMGGRGVLETGVGPLEVRADRAGANMIQAQPEAGTELDEAALAAACGVAPGSIAPAQIWSTGVPQAMLSVPDQDALTGARPDHDALRRLGEDDGWLGVSIFHVIAASQGAARVRVRHFAPRLGIAEDPVTGSAAGALGACLAAAGLAQGETLDLTVWQGAMVGRPGRVDVAVAAPGGTPEEVSVGGRVLPVVEGHLVDA